MNADREAMLVSCSFPLLVGNTRQAKDSAPKDIEKSQPRERLAFPLEAIMQKEQSQTLASIAASMEGVKEVVSLYDTVKITIKGTMYRIEVFCSVNLETWDTEVYRFNEESGQWERMDSPESIEKTRDAALRTTISFLQ